MEEYDEYYDMDEEFDENQSDEQNTRKIIYPPRLMVDFTSLGMTALLRYAQVYQLNVRDNYDKDELAALVARHFDCSLDVEEDESILSFMTRIRNGEKGVVHHRPPERSKGDKKRNKKSNSRKRQRDLSQSSREGTSGNTSGGSASGSSNGSTSSAKPTHTHEDRKHAPSSSSMSNNSSSSAHNTHHHKPANSKKSDNKKGKDEDNELYCICKMPSYGNMIACDGKDCSNPSQWYHLECVGFSDGHNPETWLCPECDPESFAELKNKKKKSKIRAKSPGTK